MKTAIEILKSKIIGHQQEVVAVHDSLIELKARVAREEAHLTDVMNKVAEMEAAVELLSAEKKGKK